MATAGGRQRFELILIKPSHYDDQGYVIQWLRSAIPSNTLAVLYGLALDCGERRILGDDVDIGLTALDETNTRIRPKKIAAQIKAAGHGMVGLVGVQSNQFPRAVDIARELRADGIQVCIGGFHVSGSIAMLPGLQPELKEAQRLGISLFAGEAEGRFDEVLCDAWAGALKPLYNYMNDLPNLEGVTPPILPAFRVSRTGGRLSSFDAGRGCPFQCSFCTIINVQGRKSRRRSADDVERIVRSNVAQGVTRFFITDDNFARNKDWEPIFDRLIMLREQEEFDIKFVIQVDTLCHRNPNFIAKAARAGVNRVFIGLESINPESLMNAKKRQNKITEYREMVLEWRKVRVQTVAGYIIGFPNETPESILRDVGIIKRELPLDCLEFFVLTPLPGSEDHKVLFDKGVAMDPDLNNYDLEHMTTAHPRMSKAEWEQAYRAAWASYYSDDHLVTVMRRAAANGHWLPTTQFLLQWFRYCSSVEKIHPLEGGYLRRRYRRDRRPGLPLENPLVFYPCYIAETVHKHWEMVRLILRMGRVRRQLQRDPAAADYMDQALMPPVEAEFDRLDLFTAHDAAKSAVAKARHENEARARQRAAV